MGYKKLPSSDGNFYKWEEEGQSLEGQWLGSLEGKYGDNGSMLVDGKKVTFSLTAALRDLDMVPKGTMVKLVMTGWKAMKGGKQPMKTFDIFVEDPEFTEDESAEVEVKGKGKGKAKDEDIPF